ncbi:XRE family transcriptional regulator [Aureimonas flava]|uniref:XRE family transcriptional regulator n=1 Tax=Aureimonas flava TaxID=2320271 RepID=A0A3A1WJX0_9HYPH|nr:XRE family transcriptional regulator [Aureimonas flava]
MTVEEFIALRKRLGLTQTQLANYLGMSLRAIQDIENGRSALRLVHVLAIERLSLSIGSALGNLSMIHPTALAEARSAAALRPLSQPG